MDRLANGAIDPASDIDGDGKPDHLELAFCGSEILRRQIDVSAVISKKMKSIALGGASFRSLLEDLVPDAKSAAKLREVRTKLAKIPDVCYKECMAEGVGVADRPTEACRDAANCELLGAYGDPAALFVGRREHKAGRRRLELLERGRQLRALRGAAGEEAALEQGQRDLQQEVELDDFELRGIGFVCFSPECRLSGFHVLLSGSGSRPSEVNTAYYPCVMFFHIQATRDMIVLVWEIIMR